MNYMDKTAAIFGLQKYELFSIEFHGKQARLMNGEKRTVKGFFFTDRGVELKTGKDSSGLCQPHILESLLRGDCQVIPYRRKTFAKEGTDND